jgi:AraC family transcriptional regulator of adaptative response/methylated-DNA-[protein]-cysteine methyltransferase
MNEIIRYAWSKSSLGEFLIAVSGKGLIAFEFGGRRATKDDALRARFPEAGIIADQDSLVDILGRIHDVIQQPQSDPGIPLDLRGSPYEVRAWSMPRNIPAGSTTSYGALAAAQARREPHWRSALLRIGRVSGRKSQ